MQRGQRSEPGDVTIMIIFEIAQSPVAGFCGRRALGVRLAEHIIARAHPLQAEAAVSAVAGAEQIVVGDRVSGTASLVETGFFGLGFLALGR
jgi:hypothetical protein